MVMKKSIRRRLVHLVITIGLLVSGLQASAQGPGNGFSKSSERKDEYGTAGFETGLKERSKVQDKEVRSRMSVLKKIGLNDIGLERINEARTKRGLPPLKIKPAKRGEEIEAAIPGAGDVVPLAGESPGAASTVAPGELPGSVDNSSLKYFLREWRP